MPATMDKIAVSPIEDIIDEARNGRMYILVDDEGRENEGDLIVPAQMATPERINFMARHGRGLICLALPDERVKALGLPLMAADNRSRNETAFTVSIEARHGVTTGISAGDRARTISVALNAAKGDGSLVSPGHVFPLAAKAGGVLIRAGHTEAAVDISRLAGLNASGVICEIMKEDGTMARLVDLVPFAAKHGLKVGTIRDLIAYRLRHDTNVEQVAEVPFESNWGGKWRAVTFRNKAVGTETVALVKGQIDPAMPALVRMHQLSLFADALGEASDRQGALKVVMETIATEGAGVIVLINRSLPDYMSIVIRGRAQGKTFHSAEMAQLRDYGLGAQVLFELGVHKMTLLTNSRLTLVGLAGYGLEIIEERPFNHGCIDD